MNNEANKFTIVGLYPYRFKIWTCVDYMDSREVHVLSIRNESRDHAGDVVQVLKREEYI